MPFIPRYSLNQLRRFPLKNFAGNFKYSKMSLKTIAVLDETELQDGEMFVVGISMDVILWCGTDSDVITGRRLPLKAKEKSSFLVSEIKYMPRVPIARIMVRHWPKASWPQMAGSYGTLFPSSSLNRMGGSRTWSACYSPWHGGRFTLGMPYKYV